MRQHLVVEEKKKQIKLYIQLRKSYQSVKSENDRRLLLMAFDH